MQVVTGENRLLPIHPRHQLIDGRRNIGGT
jgi:hypothetical protein